MPVRLGTSSWSADSWVGSFYPAGTPAADFLPWYAKSFDTVEIDATFYRTPSPAMVEGWKRKTPEGFLFASKAPQVITHEKRLEGAEEELNAYVKVMSGLGDRLGPILFQFPYFNKTDMPSPVPFFDALKKFVKALPTGFRFAVEVRNKNFLVPAFLETLRSKRIALALIDHPFMLKASEYRKRMDLLTSDWIYVRWLGDRMGIEKQIREEILAKLPQGEKRPESAEEVKLTWDKTVVDREKETVDWVAAVRDLSPKYEIYGYFNNHYAGHAPASIALFKKIWQAQGGGPIGPASPA
ncbi:MAG: DUF72 domain-containing protein [Planctomycetes bacterium]|nr:DUF72 domain-containing protein [Planctomycetota bacterium]